MNLPNLGHAVIINNVVGEMPGSMEDVQALKITYEKVGFTVQVHTKLLSAGKCLRLPNGMCDKIHGICEFKDALQWWRVEGSLRKWCQWTCLICQNSSFSEQSLRFSYYWFQPDTL